MLTKHGFKDKVTSPYHPQNNGFAEVSNREIKDILDKIMNVSRTNSDQKVTNALWAYTTIFKTFHVSI